MICTSVYTTNIFLLTEKVDDEDDILRLKAGASLEKIFGEAKL